MNTKWKLAISVVLLLALVAVVIPAIQAARDAKRLTVSQNNLKQIGVGVYNYGDVYAMIPLGADSGTDGTLHHGWQIRILPFLSAQPLYSAVDFNYAWNDPFNAPCFRFRDATWLVPGIDRITDDNGFALSHYAGNSHLFGNDYGASQKTLRAGGSHTILVGQIADSFPPWGRPGNWRDPAAGVHGGDQAFGSHHPVGVQFLMADGSVRVIERGIDPDILKSLAGSAHEALNDE